MCPSAWSHCPATEQVTDSHGPKQRGGIQLCGLVTVGANDQKEFCKSASFLLTSVCSGGRDVFLTHVKMGWGLEATSEASSPSILPPYSTGRGEVSSGPGLPTPASPVSLALLSPAWFGMRFPISSGPLGGMCWTVASSPRIK